MVFMVSAKTSAMKKPIIYISAIVTLAAMAGVTSCTSTTDKANTADSTTNTAMTADGSTTTTTTTVTRHYSGVFVPKSNVKYIDLRTHKEVTVRIDTVRGQIVNSETNDPIDLFVEPDTHDTIYGMTGSIVNNDLIHDPSGDIKVDTVKINAPEPATTTPAAQDDENYKEKRTANKTKIKTDDVKIKEKNGVIKTKER